jgi:peptidoglycan lytic transglycosylase F
MPALPGFRIMTGALACTALPTVGLLLFAACSRSADAARSRLPARLTVLVQEERSFYYRNETADLEGFNHELIERMQRQVAVSVTIKSFKGYEPMYQAFEAGEGDIMCPALALKRASPTSAALTEIGSRPTETLRFKVSNDEDFVWILRTDLGGTDARLNEWLHTTQSRLFVASLYEKYFAHLGLLNAFDLVMLKARYRRDLPRYRPLFDQAGRHHGIDPLFLAAMSYQESHWNPQATSYTGVRGLMMLTEDTASAVGVTDRTDPRQSVFGGTRYLTQLRMQIDDEVGRPDNNFFALAAYNVGLGHVEDAQELVRRSGQDPTQWSNLRDALPLLSEPAYYITLRYGKARGHEPVRYVDSIRNYYSLLSQLESPTPASRR